MDYTRLFTQQLYALRLAWVQSAYHENRKQESLKLDRFNDVIDSCRLKVEQHRFWSKISGTKQARVCI